MPSINLDRSIAKHALMSNGVIRTVAYAFFLTGCLTRQHPGDNAGGMAPAPETALGEEERTDPAHCDQSCGQLNAQGRGVDGRKIPPSASKSPISQVSITPTARPAIPPAIPQDFSAKGPHAPAKKPEHETNLIRAEIFVKDRWQSGYCADIIIRNDSKSDINSWHIQLGLSDEILTQSWNLVVVKSSKGYALDPQFDFNKKIAAGSSNKTQGFCATLEPSTHLQIETFQAF